MIKVTRLNGKEYILNAELIETVEETPDTVITLTTGKKLLVKESQKDIVGKVYEYKNNILGRFLSQDKD